MTEQEVFDYFVKNKRLPPIGKSPAQETTAKEEPLIPGVNAPIKREEQVNITATPLENSRNLPVNQIEVKGEDVFVPNTPPGKTLQRWLAPSVDKYEDTVSQVYSPQTAQELLKSTRSKGDEILAQAMRPVSIDDVDTTTERAGIEEIAKQRGLLGDGPQENLWATAIYSLGPALLSGLAGGQAALAAALPATQTSMGYLADERRRKDTQHRAAVERLDKIERAIEGRIKDKTGRAYEQAKLKLDQSKVLLDTMKAQQGVDAKLFSDIASGVQNYMNNLMKSTMGGAKNITDMEVDWEKLQESIRQKALDRAAQLEREKVKAGVQQAKPAPRTATQKAFDAVIGKKLGEWVTTDRAQLQENISNIDFAISGLEESIRTGETISGPLFGLLPEAARNAIKQKSLNIQRAIEAAKIAAMRPTLGAQFTEKEGARILSISYDPRAYAEENLRRARLIKDAVDKKVAAGDAMAAYIDKNGSLDGFDFTQWDLKPMGGVTPAIPGQQSTVSSPSQDGQRQKAMDWLQKNPNDPRADAVRKKLGL